MASDNYSSCVFINCPFDKDYDPILRVIVFTVYDCGFIPRCAREEDDSGNVRLAKIERLILESKYAIHDICRTELDDEFSLPRFNMPLELGLFLGAKSFGNSRQKKKICLILDKEPYRFQKFISDIAGQDISAHDYKPEKAITCIRNWLNTASGRRTIPGGAAILKRYKKFQIDLPAICKETDLEISEITYNDFSVFASNWLRENEEP